MPCIETKQLRNVPLTVYAPPTLISRIDALLRTRRSDYVGRSVSDTVRYVLADYYCLLCEQAGIKPNLEGELSTSQDVHTKSVIERRAQELLAEVANDDKPKQTKQKEDS